MTELNAKRGKRAAYRTNMKILEHLRVRGTISPVEALVVHGCLRLAAAIHDLRSAGYPIVTNMHTDTSGKHFARYKLARAN